MQQLSGQDASFVYLETPHTPMHIGSVGIYDPVDRARRVRAVQGYSGLHRAAPARRAQLSPAAGARAVRRRPSLLDRGSRVRHRIPRPPHRSAQARRLAATMHPGRAAPRAPDRPDQAAMGIHRGRGARQYRRPAARLLRAGLQGPSRRDRRHVRRRDVGRGPRPRRQHEADPTSPTTGSPTTCRASPIC